MIKFKSVTKTFGDLPALSDISFQVEPDELIVITGPSGSGKTTLMRLLTKELSPSEGEIIFNDQPLSKIKYSKVHNHRRQIGVVFQDYKLLPELNVWENIALPLSITGKTQDEIESRVTDLLNLISLEEKVGLFPSQLSGGEAQRVSIARALAVAPKVIFADEPTGNLDQESAALIINLLKKINELGTTLLMATHDLTALDLLAKKRHLRIENGKLVQDTSEKKPQAKPKTKTEDKNPEKEVQSEVKPQPEPQKKKAKPKTRIGLGIRSLTSIFSKKNTDAVSEKKEEEEEKKEEEKKTKKSKEITKDEKAKK